MHDPWSDKLWKVVHMLGIYSPKGASMVSREQAERRLPFSPLRQGAFVWALCGEGFNAIVTVHADSLILGTNLFSCLIYLTYLASSFLPLLNLNFNRIIPESYYKKGYSSDNYKYSPILYRVNSLAERNLSSWKTSRDPSSSLHHFCFYYNLYMWPVWSKWLSFLNCEMTIMQSYIVLIYHFADFQNPLR